MHIDGGCHCGNITYEADINPEAVSLCHCSDCQTMTGTAYRVNVRVKKANFKLSGGKLKLYVKTAESGNKRTQAFCPECGTRMPHKIKTTDNMLIPAGVLDTDPVARPTNSIFWKSKAVWDHSPQELPQLDEYQ